MPIHFGEGARMRIVYTTARFEVTSHRSIGQSTLHRLWRRLLRHPESHRSIGQFTLNKLLKHPESHRSIGQSTFARAFEPSSYWKTADWRLCWGRLKVIPPFEIPPKMGKSAAPRKRSHRVQHKPREPCACFPDYGRRTQLPQNKSI